MKDDAITDELRIALDNVHEAERKRTVVIHHIDAFDRSRQKRAARSALRLRFPLIRSTARESCPSETFRLGA